MTRAQWLTIIIYSIYAVSAIVITENYLHILETIAIKIKGEKIGKEVIVNEEAYEIIMWLRNNYEVRIAFYLLFISKALNTHNIIEMLLITDNVYSTMWLLYDIETIIKKEGLTLNHSDIVRILRLIIWLKRGSIDPWMSGAVARGFQGDYPLAPGPRWTTSHDSGICLSDLEDQ